jgi:hypothetical protein
MKRASQISLSLVTLIAIAFAWSQERWLLRFSVKEGVPLDWHMRVVTKKVINKKAEMEVTELWVREQVEQIRPNGNLVWSSQVTRCVINGEVIPAEKLERTVSELTPLGYPARTITIPPPSLNQLDDWLLDLFGGISLVFPLSEIGNRRQVAATDFCWVETAERTEAIDGNLQVGWKGDGGRERVLQDFRCSCKAR